MYVSTWEAVPHWGLPKLRKVKGIIGLKLLFCQPQQHWLMSICFNFFLQECNIEWRLTQCMSCHVCVCIHTSLPVLWCPQHRLYNHISVRGSQCPKPRLLNHTPLYELLCPWNHVSLRRLVSAESCMCTHTSRHELHCPESCVCNRISPDYTELCVCISLHKLHCHESNVRISLNGLLSPEYCVCKHKSLHGLHCLESCVCQHVYNDVYRYVVKYKNQTNVIFFWCFFLNSCSVGFLQILQHQSLSRRLSVYPQI